MGKSPYGTQACRAFCCSSFKHFHLPMICEDLNITTQRTFWVYIWFVRWVHAGCRRLRVSLSYKSENQTHREPDRIWRSHCVGVRGSREHACSERNIFITMSKDVSPTRHLLRRQQTNNQQTFPGRRNAGVQVLTTAPFLSDTNTSRILKLKQLDEIQPPFYYLHLCFPHCDMSKCPQNISYLHRIVQN